MIDIPYFLIRTVHRSINYCNVYQQIICARSFQFNFREKRAEIHMFFFFVPHDRYKPMDSGKVSL